MNKNDKKKKETEKDKVDTIKKIEKSLESIFLMPK